ncbi:nitroreductase family protein [Pseudonocardia eucalypti]|uniref:Nitroreductase family protein n=1 Tax=Pseudonocardia eucalypti TaxID=648755 RepID=A0ABP9QI95_9PSEU|nr:hypothetical protein [Pseudonocardia eucalypti]
MPATLVPVGGLSTEQVREALLAATRAPSLHNSQPWRFRCTPSTIELHADVDRALPAADPDNRELLLACGAALLNLRLAIRGLGYYPDVRLFPDHRRPELLATVRPRGHQMASPAEQRLIAAIPRRRTNRQPFFDETFTGPERDALRRAAEAERSWLALLPPEQVPTLRQLVQQAHFLQQEDPGFVAEWQRWTGRPFGESDGVPVSSGGPLPEAHDEWTLRDFTAGQGRRRVEGKDFESAPLIVVIGSFHDLPPARLQAGQAMQRVLLTAIDHGMSASFLSQVVEVPETRRKLRTLIGGGLWPQAVLRLGRGSPVPRTPRRPLEDLAEVTDVEPEA